MSSLASRACGACGFFLPIKLSSWYIKQSSDSGVRSNFSRGGSRIKNIYIAQVISTRNIGGLQPLEPPPLPTPLCHLLQSFSMLIYLLSLHGIPIERQHSKGYSLLLRIWITMPKVIKI